MIFYDPSESRANTRLAQPVIDVGQPLNGLEAATGADILLTPLALPLKPLDDEATMRLLQRHVQAGLLVQRKTGRDAVNSIPHYPAILQRMLEWTNRPYLVLIGQYGSDRENKVVVDGTPTDWNWNAWCGALNWWQLRGGYIHYLSRDGQLLQYLRQWLDTLASDEWTDGTTKHLLANRPPKQVIGEPSWASVVCALGIGFGPDKAEWLMDNFRSMASFVTFFTDTENARLLQKGSGIGPSHFAKVRKLYGLTDDKDILIQYIKET